MASARRRREAARKHHLKTRHRMTPEQYAELLAFQGGKCYMCPARGVYRALSVDHDHAIAREMCDHPHEESCSQCWRGLLCSTCNKIFGHARDDAEFFRRGIEYLRNPPTREMVSAREST